jgi:hypothetical protein
MPTAVLSLRRRAMMVKTQINRTVDGWRELFYEKYPELECGSDDEGSNLVTIQYKRGVTDAGGEPSSKRLKSATVSVNPDKQPNGDEEQVQQPTDSVSFQQEEDLVIVGTVPPPGAPDRMSYLEGVIKQMSSKLQTLTRAQELRDQQDLLDEDEEVSKKLSALEKRTAYVEVVKAVTPGLDFPEMPPEGDQQAHFKSFAPRAEAGAVPFVKPLLQYIETISKPPAQGQRREPLKCIDKYYKAVKDVEQCLLKPRFIPASLLNEVPDKLRFKPGSSGAEARLKKDTPNGQEELAALKDFKTSTAMLRLVNTQELSLYAMNVYSDRVKDGLDSLASGANVPAIFKEELQTVQKDMTDILTILEDMGKVNTFMARGVVHQYTDALRSRRHAWVTSSTLPPGTQEELMKAPLDIMKPGAAEPLCILAPNSVKHIKEHVQSREAADMRAIARKAVASTQPRGRGNGKKGNNNNRRKQLDWNAVSPAAQAAGWQTTQGVGRGKPRGGRAGRGRGQQPFSSSSASATSK